MHLLFSILFVSYNFSFVQICNDASSRQHPDRPWKWTWIILQFFFPHPPSRETDYKSDLSRWPCLPKVKGNEELREEDEFTYNSRRRMYPEERDDVHLQPVLNRRSHHSSSHQPTYCYDGSLPCKNYKNTKIDHHFRVFLHPFSKVSFQIVL